MPNAVTNASNDFVVNINMCPPNKSCIAFVINTPGTIGMTAAMIIVAKSPVGISVCPITAIIPITNEPMNSGINCACNLRSKISVTRYLDYLLISQLKHQSIYHLVNIRNSLQSLLQQNL